MTLECPSRLPPEIIGQIVSIVSADRNTLLACALVCQDWLSESRPLLLRDIEISPETLNSFTSNILRSDRVRPWLTSIHNLSLGYFYDNEEETFIPDISELLSNLRRMAWTHIFPRRASLRAGLIPALGQFAHLRQLKLVLCDFASFGDLTSFVVALPSLSSLAMWQVVWDDADPDPTSVLAPPRPEPRPTLSELSILAAARAQEPNDIFHWLSSTPTRYALRDLSLDLCKIFAGLEVVAAGTPLTALTVRMKGLSQVLGDDARLARLAQLLSRAGDIGLLRLHARFNHSFLCSDVARVLRLFTSVSSIRRLRLCYRPTPYIPCDTEGLYRSFEELDPILEDNTFRSLEYVEFAWFTVEEDEDLPSKYDWFSGGLRRKLPKLHERVAVDVYVYNSRCAFGPTGFTDDILHAPDFPYRDNTM